MKGDGSDRRDAIFPNQYDPAPLMLGDALAHVASGPFFAALRRWWYLAVPVATAVAFWFHPAVAAAQAAGLLTALVAVTTTYLWWHAGFARNNASRGTICPHCLSRMWQFCCARCREPVPPLAFFWRGVFMPACPHCNFALSSRGGTLLAWCSTCSYAIEYPHRFYALRVQLAVMALSELPDQSALGDGWRIVPIDWSTRLALYRIDSQSAVFFIVVDYVHDDLRFDPFVPLRARMVFTEQNTPGIYLERLQALFPTAQVGIAVRPSADTLEAL